MKMVICKLMTIANGDILLTTKDSILLTGCTHEDGQLQTDDSSKQEGVHLISGQPDLTQF